MAEQTKSTSAVQQILDAAKKLPGNIVGGPVDLINLVAGLATGKGAEGLSKKPVGGSKQINELFGLGDSAGLVEDVVSAAMGMVSPGGAAKAVIVPAVLLKDAVTLNRARGMQNMGASPGRIFQETKTYPGTGDNILRAVISDEGAKVKPQEIKKSDFTGAYLSSNPGQFLRLDAFKEVPLESVLDHPELFKVLPEIKTMPVRGKLFGAGEAGYNPTGTTGQFGSVAIGTTKSEKEFLQLLLHEIQHGVQNYSGMAQGGNSRMFVDSRMPKAIEEIKTMLTTQHQKVEKGTKTPYTEDYIKRLESGLREAKNTERMGQQLYLRMAGEAEARAVENAVESGKFTAFPPSLYDVPISELIAPNQVQRIRPSQNLQDLIDILVK